tara:strand:+ start:191 stop:469 length:279 start_codon:yes stop_codon:yes gene_type:complete
MGSMNISIKEDAYKFLRSMKGRDESFSDVILGFKEKKTSNGKMLVELRNKYDEKLKDIDFSDVEKNIKGFREEVEERMDETAEYMRDSREGK